MEFAEEGARSRVETPIPASPVARFGVRGLAAIVGGGVIAIIAVLAANRALPVRASAVGPEPSQLSSAPSRLRVETQPAGATVIIDGTSRGLTPLALTLEPGIHFMTVRGKHDERVVTLTATPGADVAQYFELKVPTRASVVSSPPKAFAPSAGSPSAGWLSVKAPFDVQILEGPDLIWSGGMAKVMLPAGRHDLVIINRALEYQESRSIVVAAGAVTSLQVNAPQATLNVNARPWAEVTIAGNSVGQTPIANLAVPIGNHDVVFSHPQLGERRQRIAVTVNGPNRIAVDLTK